MSLAPCSEVEKLREGYFLADSEAMHNYKEAYPHRFSKSATKSADRTLAWLPFQGLSISCAFLLAFIQ